MAKKILIFGATGAVGSSLAHMMKEGPMECHMIGKNHLLYDISYDKGRGINTKNEKKSVQARDLMYKKVFSSICIIYM